MLTCCCMESFTWVSLQSPDEEAAFAAVQEAFKNGVNFFDVAPFYASGDAEKVWQCFIAMTYANTNSNMVSWFCWCENSSAVACLQLLGRAIKDLPRDKIIVATKVGKYRAGEPADFSGTRVTKSVHESLERLQLKYIDLIQIHDIEFCEDMRQVSCWSSQFSRWCLAFTSS